MSAALRGQRILITGASMGIGEALAREFAKGGAELLLVARSEAKLQVLREELRPACGHCEYWVADLSKPEQVSALIEKILAEGRLDGLVLNAGIGLYGRFADIPETDSRELFEINSFLKNP